MVLSFDLKTVRLTAILCKNKDGGCTICRIPSEPYTAHKVLIKRKPYFCNNICSYAKDGCSVRFHVKALVR